MAKLIPIGEGGGCSPFSVDADPATAATSASGPLEVRPVLAAESLQGATVGWPHGHDWLFFEAVDTALAQAGDVLVLAHVIDGAAA